MTFYIDGVVPWNSLNDNTRAPLSSELEAGYPCGEADQELFNWTAGWPIGHIWNMLADAGITPDPAKLRDLSRAVQSGKVNVASVGGTDSNITATLAPSPVISDGFMFRLKTASANTDAVTLNLNGLGAKPVLYPDQSQIAPGDFHAGFIPLLAYRQSLDAWICLNLSFQAIKRRSLQLSTVRFTASGSFSFTVPANVFTVRVLAWGAGGGSGRAATPSGSAGGGGGGYFEVSVPVTPGMVINGSVGAGGAAGTAGGNGGNGGDTTIIINGITYTAGGGLGGTNAAANAVTNSSAGGSVSGPVDVSRPGYPSQGGNQGYSGTAILYYGGLGGPAPNGGNGGNSGTSQGNAGAIPGGGAGGSGANGSSNNGNTGARGELWIQY